jgi:acetyl-CoA carboxylase carboxyl transferase alpha subunit/acetyl-CoA carboxylase carboxyl transferase beta subunit
VRVAQLNGNGNHRRVGGQVMSTPTIVRPRAGARDWTLCRGCRALVYGPRLNRNLGVCPECGLHAPLGAVQRLGQLLDPDWQELDLPAATQDVLDWVDARPYPDRIAQARAATGLDEGVVVARGAIRGNPVIAAVMDFRFMGGSLGAAVGERITLAAETALRSRTPLLLVTASGGARMQEGIVSLMQMVKTSQALAELDEAGVLTVSLITDPTFGGVAASFATLTDVIIAESGARLGFAGPRVIAQTIKQSLPEGFQTADFLLGHGLVDAVRPRSALRTTLARLLSAGARRPSEASPAVGGDRVVRDPARLPEQDPWDAVRQARDLRRPTTLDYVHRLVDDFEELRGDRLGADCPSLVGGIGRLDGTPLLVIGHQKGHDARELAARNYGMPAPAGYRKAARLMRLAAKLGLPVLALIDTPGAYPGISAEEHGQSVAIAESIRFMAGLPVPVVSVVIGEGGSGGALALGVANRVLICENAVYSVISPEGCAAILWNDPKESPRAARALRLNARELLRLGVVDGVVPEPAGGTGTDHRAASELLRSAVTRELDSLAALEAPDLIADRRARFRRIGAPEPMLDEAVPTGGHRMQVEDAR